MQLERRQLSAPVGRLGRLLTRFVAVVRSRQTLALLGVLALAAYLRLWNIEHLFNILHDYDEGAYSLGARFISQGYLPYRDFVLVHPPLYDLVLAGLYKVSGYSFFYGRYLSVALSLVAILLLYLIGKRMYHPAAGLTAAALFAVSPMVMYLGRRAVQESLGILLILVAVYFAVAFIDNRKEDRLLFCGLALGLAVATKYLFIPVAVGVVATVVLITAGEGFWRSIRGLARAQLWLFYACLAAVIYSLLLLFKWVFRIDVSIPLIEPLYLTPGNVAVAVLVFVVPFFASAALLKMQLPARRLLRALWNVKRDKGLWLLAGGTVLGFFCVTAYFWIVCPQEFVGQTVLMQQSRSLAEFPSLTGMIRLTPLNTGFLRMISLPIMLVIPFVLLILSRRTFAEKDYFVAMVLLVSFVLCQGFPAMPRYYASLYPFLFLAMSSMVPPLDPRMLASRLKAGLLVVLTVFLLFLSLSVILLKNYTGYDALLPGAVFSTNEEEMYDEALGFLEEAGATKIYATSPSFPAMSPELDCSRAFDIFALLWLEGKPTEEIVQNLIDEGVDYVLLDEWIRYWGGPKTRQVRELTAQVRNNGRLVKVIEPDSPCMVEIYRLGAEPEGVFNGDFDQWVTQLKMELPLGWEPVLVDGGNDVAGIGRAHVAGKDCVRLIVCEYGQKDDKRESTHAGVSQKFRFPEAEVRVEILPQVNAAPSGRPELLSGIHFTDESGHSVVVGFSGSVTGEQVFEHESGYRLLVLKEAQMGEWSQQTIDLARYWDGVGWPRPREVSMLVVSSAHYQNPGCYSLCVASVGVGGG